MGKHSFLFGRITSMIEAIGQVGGVHKMANFLELKRTYKNWLLPLVLRGTYNSRTKLEISSDISIVLKTDDYYSRLLFHRAYSIGSYESASTRILIRSLKPGMNFFDIGANIGYYSLIASALVGDTGSANAYEMEPTVFNILKANVQINGFKFKNIKLHRVVVTDYSGISAYTDAGIGGAGYFLNMKKKLDNEVKNVVKCITHHECIAQENIKPDFIKIDVEGAEFNVLNGAKNILSKLKPKILCEIHHSGLPLFGHRPQDVVDLLFRYNMKVYEVLDKDGKVELDSIKCLPDNADHTKMLLVVPV